MTDGQPSAVASAGSRVASGEPAGIRISVSSDQLGSRRSACQIASTPSGLPQ
jgi:hypothetical protein